MASSLETPTEEATGIALLIAPNMELMQGDPDACVTEHHLYHPNSHPSLAGIGGRALRSSRVQLLLPEQHNYGKESYHALYSGPLLPSDEAKQFGLCVLSAAGYLPRQVLDISGEPGVRLMTDEEESYFRSEPQPKPVTPGEVRRYYSRQQGLWHERQLLRESTNAEHPISDELLSKRAIRRLLVEKRARQATFSLNGVSYSYDPLKKFFINYLQRPEMFDFKPKFIKRFLSSRDEAERQNLGEQLLLRVSAVATANLQKSYREALESQRLNKHMPQQPSELVRDKLGAPWQRRALLPLFARRAEETVLQAA